MLPVTKVGLVLGRRGFRTREFPKGLYRVMCDIAVAPRLSLPRTQSSL